MLHDNEVRALRDQWTVDDMPVGLADRITRNALAHKQHRPLFARLKDALAMPENGGYAWKGGFAVAACLMVAIALMNNSPTPQKPVYKKPMNQLIEEMYYTY